MTGQQRDAAYAAHELAPRREEAAWPFEKKLDWLEEAHELVLQMQSVKVSRPDAQRLSTKEQTTDE
jgi:hypothetical protein